ncbi:MAG: hypothetical protein U0175_32370 [Caldilineaceae bacterium]
MTTSSISLLDTAAQEPARILQLYQFLELFIEGEPPRNTLFVLERAPLSVMGANGDRLLLIDPPASATAKFHLEGAATSIFTGEVRESGLPQLQTKPGGVAHIRMGEHFLDIYSQQDSNVIYFPALGILCAGSFGSDATIPKLAAGSDGNEELATLRLLAQLVKRNLRLFLPQVGTFCEEARQAMQRLAEDVGYLHSLRRVVPFLAQRGDALENVWQVAESLLPKGRNSSSSKLTHQRNIEHLWSISQITN